MFLLFSMLPFPLRASSPCPVILHTTARGVHLTVNRLMSFICLWSISVFLSIRGKKKNSKAFQWLHISVPWTPDFSPLRSLNFSYTGCLLFYGHTQSSPFSVPLCFLFPKHSWFSLYYWMLSLEKRRHGEWLHIFEGLVFGRQAVVIL